MRKKKVLFVLLSMSLLIGLFGVVGCGGAGGFAGSWELTGSETDGVPATQEDLDSMRALGLTVELTLNKDGSATLTEGGNSVEGTWTEIDSKSCTITTDNKFLEVKLENGKLKFELNGSMVEMSRK